MFAPVDVNGPDQRRKQLIAKLLQQAQQHGAANAGTPLGRGASGLGGGSAVGFFHSPGQTLPASARALGTQSMGLVPSGVGIGYSPQANEASAAPGLALPFQSAGLPNLGFSWHDIPEGVGIPTPGQASPIPTAPELPSGLSASPSSAFGTVTTLPEGSFISLGGGHFYDPITDSVGYHPGLSNR